MVAHDCALRPDINANLAQAVLALRKVNTALSLTRVLRNNGGVVPEQAHISAQGMSKAGASGYALFWHTDGQGRLVG
jgi:hypothetical protein